MLLKVDNVGFKNIEIRKTDDIELLRSSYEKLLVEYERLIFTSVTKDCENNKRLQK